MKNKIKDCEKKKLFNFNIKVYENLEFHKIKCVKFFWTQAKKKHKWTGLLKYLCDVCVHRFFLLLEIMMSETCLELSFFVRFFFVYLYHICIYIMRSEIIEHHQAGYELILKWEDKCEAKIWWKNQHLMIFYDVFLFLYIWVNFDRPLSKNGVQKRTFSLGVNVIPFFFSSFSLSMKVK